MRENRQAIPVTPAGGLAFMGLPGFLAGRIKCREELAERPELSAEERAAHWRAAERLRKEAA